jgi:predicted aspartyl protease
VPVRAGSIVNGHPYIEILVSPDGKKSAKQAALVDTGFSGFISVSVESAALMGLRAHATTLYTLANSRVSDPVPLANGYACRQPEGDRSIASIVPTFDSLRI